MTGLTKTVVSGKYVDLSIGPWVAMLLISHTDAEVPFCGIEIHEGISYLHVIMLLLQFKWWGLLHWGLRFWFLIQCFCTTVERTGLQNKFVSDLSWYFR